MNELKQSAQAVQETLAASGLQCEVVELPASTRTAKEAAEAIGCTVDQIAKSIVFRARRSDRAVLVVASGINRIDENAIIAALGEPIEKAAPDFVRARTGFAIGGVPPCGHACPPVTFVDAHLLSLGDVWAAAGTPNAVFRIAAERLVELTGGKVLKVA